MNEYKDILAAFCYYTSQFSRMSTMIQNGEVIPREQIDLSTSRLSKLKKLLLEKKEVLGLDGGLSFLENNKFNGFEIKDGQFIGTLKTVDAIIKPWIEGFPEKSNCYLYEVANYIYFLSNPDILDAELEEYNNTVSSVSSEVTYFGFAIIKRRFLAWIKRAVLRYAAWVQAEREDFS